MRSEWSREPVPYGQPGWAAQLDGNEDDYVVSGVMPSSEYKWREARRRPEFTALVEWLYSVPEFRATNDYYDWGNDEATESFFISAGEAPTAAVEAEAKARGFELEWGDVAAGEAKAWFHDPVVMAAMDAAADYNVYTMRSTLGPVPAGGE